MIATLKNLSIAVAFLSGIVLGLNLIMVGSPLVSIAAIVSAVLFTYLSK